MQLLEILLTSLAAIAAASLFLPNVTRLFFKSVLVASLCVFLVQLFVGGARWQMSPVYLLLLAVALFGLRARASHFVLRILGFAFCTVALVLSVFLSTQFPVRDLPEPTGPYSIGTFSAAMIDGSRVERYEPAFNRGVSIQAWYPASISEAGQWQRESLFKELYSGEYDVFSFLFGYLERVETHSYINAPISLAETFPLIVFNHGLFMIAGQSPQLMEHLASHGYIVVSITHPFESLKVTLPDRGSRGFSMDYPLDVGFSSDEISDGGIGDRIGSITGVDHSNIATVLYEQMDIYNAAPPNQRDVLLENAAQLPSLQSLGPVLNAENLSAFFEIRSKVRNRSMEYWVEDIQFVVENLRSLDAPIQDWDKAVDTRRVGALGYSYGGSAVGEFCKTDARCAAGSNLDGTQFGYNWQAPVQAPFLLINTDTNPGGNNYAYYPPQSDFIDLLIPGTEHPDLMDSLLLFPMLRTLGLSGEMPYQDLADIVKDLELAFFDEYLKGKAGAIADALARQGNSVEVFSYLGAGR